MNKVLLLDTYSNVSLLSRVYEIVLLFLEYSYIHYADYFDDTHRKISLEINKLKNHKKFLFGRCYKS